MPKNNDLQAILFDEKKITELLDNEKNRSKKIELIQEILHRRKKQKKIYDPEMYKDGITIDEMLKTKLETVKNEPDIKKKTVYDVEELIWWKGSEPMIIYLFDLLSSANLIDDAQARQRNSMIAKHFKNVNGKKFDNKQLGKSYSRMKDKKPNAKDADTIEQVLRDIRQYLKEINM